MNRATRLLDLEPAIRAQLPFAAAERDSINTTVIKPDETSRLSSLRLDQAELEKLKEDIESGCVVIVPVENPAFPRLRTGWWRIDPQTGETPGMVSDGHGAEAVEDQSLNLAYAGMLGGMVGGTCIIMTEDKTAD